MVVRRVIKFFRRDEFVGHKRVSKVVRIECIRVRLEGRNVCDMKVI